MANLFDSTNAPEGEPLELVVGDFIQWKRSDLVNDYPSSLYSAEYVARVTQGGSSEIKLAGVGSADNYLFTVDSSTSADFDAGFYHWQLEITETSSGNRIVVQRGEFHAIVDLDVNGTDPRTHSEVMLDKIETILEGKADSDVSNYSIAGRSLTKMTFDELMVARDRYRQEVLAYRRKLAIKSGKASGTTVKVRFS
jgi:hypothetical protein